MDQASTAVADGVAPAGTPINITWLAPGEVKLAQIGIFAVEDRRVCLDCDRIGTIVRDSVATLLLTMKLIDQLPHLRTRRRARHD